MSQRTRRFVLASALAFVLAGFPACRDLPTDDVQGARVDRTGRVMFLLHGRTIGGYRNAFVTVDSVEFLGADDAALATFALDPPVRIDLINSSHTEFLACVDEAPAGTHNKLRLRVSDPLFVRTDDSEIKADEIQLNADGKLDLNTQGDAFAIEADADNIVEFLLSDADNALMITETAGGTFILRTELFQSVRGTPSAPVLIRSAIVAEIDDDGAELTLALPNCQRRVTLDEVTVILNVDGEDIAPDDLDLDIEVEIQGSFNDDGVSVHATQIIVVAE